jgi:hypothetical protein
MKQRFINEEEDWCKRTQISEVDVKGTGFPHTCYLMKRYTKVSIPDITI